ncbi:MAG TPA: DUF2283 domain-containing protein [Candidatus Bathyarchaeia archaeon]|nr:DUF2283 domain-containing protein [Candidatus Bathyarchaeia archaeon]
MEEEALKIWFDPEGDLLEIGQTKPTKGFFRDVGDDVFVRVDCKGNITGLLILNATKRMAKIREVKLPEKATFLKQKNKHHK